MTKYRIYEHIRHDGDSRPMLLRYDEADSLEEATKLANIELAGRAWEITAETTVAAHEGAVEVYDAM